MGGGVNKGWDNVIFKVFFIVWENPLYNTVPKK